MNIKIITIHSIHNFGSVFQALALQRYIELCGHSVEVIDYRPIYFTHGRSKLKTVIGRILNIKSYLNRKYKFDSFIKNNIAISEERFLKYNDLFKLRYTADLYISGGDQIWNDYHFSGRDDAFKLQFVPGERKIAFGTSMGRDDFTECEIDTLWEKVKEYEFIGLRESSSLKYFDKIGINKVKHVVDPVLLLDKMFYLKYVSSVKYKKYALVYLADKSEILDRVVHVLKNQFDLEIVHVCGFKKKVMNDHMLKDSGPDEILSLLYSADYVVSASYHATLFSLLFNKQFISLLPHKKTNARILDLLNKVDLKQRIVTDEKTLNCCIKNNIDFQKSNLILGDFIRQSKNNLNSYLSNDLEEK